MAPLRLDRRAPPAADAARSAIGAAIDPDRLVETLSMPEQQIVEIAKAIGADARIVIMDEPTASLTEREVERLFARRRAAARRTASASSTSRIASRRSCRSPIASRCCATARRSRRARRDDVDRAGLIRMMVGRELSAVFPKRTVPLGEVALELRGTLASGDRRRRRLVLGPPRRDSRHGRARRVRDGRSSPKSCSG